MVKQPIPLTPTDVRVLAQCSLHYHFLQQRPAAHVDPDQAILDELVRETIQNLHAAGGPARMSLRACLHPIQTQRLARQMVERYYRRLEKEWANMIASNETMALRISLAGVSIALRATVDRLDKTSDGGILAMLFRTEAGSPPRLLRCVGITRLQSITRWWRQHIRSSGRSASRNCGYAAAKASPSS